MNLFGAVPDVLRRHLPSFGHALVDLACVAEEHRRVAALRAGFYGYMAMNYYGKMRIILYG